MSEKKNQNEELVAIEDRAKTSTSKESGSKKAKPKKERKSLGRKFKEIFSELKKVSWPTFPKVVKNTGVVLVVVLFFLIILGLFDGGLSALMKLVVNK